MKAQHTNTSAKLSKKTVFVYKNIKAKNSLFETTPTGDQSHTVVMTSWIDVILYLINFFYNLFKIIIS
jgi:hypothetical protein